MGGMRRTHCRHCEQALPDGWHEERERRRRETLKASFVRRREMGIRIGRDYIPYEEMVRLRNNGRTYREIAKIMGVCLRTVANSLRRARLNGAL